VADSLQHISSEFTLDIVEHDVECSERKRTNVASTVGGQSKAAAVRNMDAGASKHCTDVLNMALGATEEK
jgi:hypothetical protein